MNKNCIRCGAKSSTVHSIALIDVDPESMSEGEHLGDVDFHLCGECVGDVADMLVEFKEQIKGSAAREILLA